MHDRYNLLYSSIVTSSIWVEDPVTLKVWVAMLALKDSNGFVPGSVPGFANLCNISIEQMETALACLMSPDPHSRTPAFEGRRIEKVDGGWRVLNAEAYDTAASIMRRRANNRRAQQRRRQRGDPDDSNPPSASDDDGHADNGGAEADDGHESSALVSNPSSPTIHNPQPQSTTTSESKTVIGADGQLGWDEGWEVLVGTPERQAVYPDSISTNLSIARMAWKGLMLRSDVSPSIILNAARRYRRQCEHYKTSPKFVMSLQKFLDPLRRSWEQEFPISDDDFSGLQSPSWMTEIQGKIGGEDDEER